MGEAAAVAALALALLEGKAHSGGSGLSGRTHARSIADLVGESARVAAVALPGLEFKADAVGAGTKLSAVRESAHRTTIALALLECKAHANLALLLAAKVGEGAGAASSSVREAAGIAALALSLLEGVALLHTAGLLVAASAAPITAHWGRTGSGEVVGESAGVTAVTLALLEGVADIVAARSIGGHLTHFVGKSAGVSAHALSLLKRVANTRHLYKKIKL